MSYDITLENEEGDIFGDFNITYNVTVMFQDFEKEEGIRGLYGMTGEQGAVFLSQMITHFLHNRVKLKSMNPRNGWGSYENTLLCVTKMFTVSIQNPTCVWSGD